jgi:hypothetical protein
VSAPSRLRLLGQFRLELGTELVELCRNSSGCRPSWRCGSRCPGRFSPAAPRGRLRGRRAVTPALGVDVQALTRTDLGAVEGGSPPFDVRPPLGLHSRDGASCDGRRLPPEC